MFKIVILEDNSRHAASLLTLLNQYAASHESMRYSVQLYDRTITFLTEYSCDADMLLLDIQMPDISGIEAARRIREIDDRVMIIFTTSLAQYAIEGYSVRAFDYVLKPLLYDMFAAKLDRAFRVLAHAHISESIEIRTKSEVRRVAVSGITYVEVANHDLLIHTDDSVYRQWGSLKDMEEQLKGMNFVRCNACYLVNLKYVKGIAGDKAMVDRDALSISKSRRKEFLTALAQYKGGSR